jgi:hypothetical protein
MTSPVLETNIERILQDHIFREMDLLDLRVADLQAQIEACEARKLKLQRIADAAELPSPIRITP